MTAGKDKSIRMWKVVEETQLLFQGTLLDFAVSIFSFMANVRCVCDRSLQIYMLNADKL